jgi:hypothetical protein
LVLGITNKFLDSKSKLCQPNELLVFSETSVEKNKISHDWKLDDINCY